MLAIDPKAARSAWSRAIVYAATAVALLVIWVIRKTLLVFATALMVAYLLYPFVDAVDRRLSGKKRPIAAALPFLLLVGVLVVFGMATSSRISHEFSQLLGQVDSGSFGQQVSKWRVFGEPVGEKLLTWYNEEHVAVNISELRQTAGITGRYFLNLFIIPILSFLILKDGRQIRDAILDIFDGNGHAEGFLADAHKLLLEYMRSLLYLCLATLISFTIALNLMHVRYASLLGLIAFTLEFIPLAGPLTSAVIIIGFSEFNHYDHILWIVAFLLAYRLFQDYVLSPHLMRKGVKLDPLLILFGIFAGGEIGNVPGIFLSVPVLALMRLMFYELRKPRAGPRETTVSV